MNPTRADVTAVCDPVSNGGGDGMSCPNGDVQRPAPNPPADDSATPALNRRQMARNVAANWAGHFVFVAGGFLVPRLIADRIGEVRLGIWDFGWSFVAYVSLITAGITSSTNRFVARYRATRDWERMNQAVGACVLIFLVTGALAAALTLTAAALLPHLLEASLAGYETEARAVVLLLGMAAAVQMPLGVCGGVITGCERYDLVTSIEAGCYAALVTGIGVALWAGAGLTILAGLVLAAELAMGSLKYVGAQRVCPALRVSPRGATRTSIREVTLFGWKNFLESGGKIVLYQTTSMLVFHQLGPAALALYARSTALIQHATKLMYQFGRVFTPTASAMQARGDAAGVARLLMTATRQSLFLSLPMTAVLVFLGGPLLRVWMGPSFERPAVLAILAVGHLGALTHCATYYVLLGLDRHGAVGLATAVAGVCGVIVAAALMIGLGWDLTGAAIAVAIAVSGLSLVAIPLLASKRVNVSPWRYLAETAPGPTIAVAPFVAWLAFLRFGTAATAPVKLGLGLGVGAVILAATYWYAALTPAMRKRVAAAVVSRLRRPRRGTRTTSPRGMS